ncbi:MAG: enoyl-CoA hydratase [Thermaerobacter sp.]|nr:enoyl-CoA hydratase [Thermaerobacter sp.]
MSHDATTHADPGEVTLTRSSGGIATLILSRPRYLNAMTWTMYTRLAEHLRTINQDPDVRVVVLRGAGSAALASGTDIHQFEHFDEAQGVAYEEQVDAIVSMLATLPKPTLAAIEGYAVGGGMALAAVCDLRYANTSARIGVPIAKSLGNCLAFSTYRRLAQTIGVSKVKELIYTGRLMTAAEAKSAGFLADVFADDTFAGHLQDTVDTIAAHAPLTLWATKTAFLRWEEFDREHIDRNIPFDDVIRRVYGSADFRQAVRARMKKRHPVWTGR